MHEKARNATSCSPARYEGATDLQTTINDADNRATTRQGVRTVWLVAIALLFATIYINVGRASPYIRLLQFILLFAWAVYFTAVLRQAWRSTALTIASVAFSLIVLEAVAHLAASPPATMIVDGSLHANRPEIGWGPSRAGTFHASKIAGDGDKIYDASYTIDANLLRHTESVSGTRPVAFIGDSFTFGEGVDDAGTMPQAFADLTGRTIPVMNLGYSGYGPSQALRALQVGLFDKALGKPRAFVLFTSAWHAERTGCLAGFSLRGPRYTWDGSELTYRGACATLWNGFVHSLLDNTAFYRVFLASRLAPKPSFVDFDTYAQIVRAIGQYVHERYQAPLIVLYPKSGGYLADTTWTDEKMMNHLKMLGLIVLDATLPARPELIIAGDGHPTAAAHRMRAEALVEYVRKADPSLLSP